MRVGRRAATIQGAYRGRQERLALQHIKGDVVANSSSYVPPSFVCPLTLEVSK